MHTLKTKTLLCWEIEKSSFFRGTMNYHLEGWPVMYFKHATRSGNTSCVVKSTIKYLCNQTTHGCSRHAYLTLFDCNAFVIYTVLDLNKMLLQRGLGRGAGQQRPTRNEATQQWTILQFWMTGWWFQPLWKIWVRQLGLLFPICGKIKVMFQTTNESNVYHV